MSTTWPTDRQTAALQEGWDIFSNDSYDHEPFELCRVDFPDAWGDDVPFDEPAFEGDAQAWEHVIAKAVEGSELHNQALAFLAQESPGEFVHIALFRAGVEPCPCAGCASMESGYA